MTKRSKTHFTLPLGAAALGAALACVVVGVVRGCVGPTEPDHEARRGHEDGACEAGGVGATTATTSRPSTDPASDPSRRTHLDPGTEPGTEPVEPVRELGTSPGGEPDPDASAASEALATTMSVGGAAAVAAASELPTSLRRGLLIAYSSFLVENGEVRLTAPRARADLLTRSGGEWRVDSFEDPGSGAFHKAMPFLPPGGRPGIVTLQGTAASVKLWHRGPNGWTSETLWLDTESIFFGDAEAGNLFGDGEALAIATPAQGVTTLRWVNGRASARRIDPRPYTLMPELEIGDLNGNGQREIYAPTMNLDGQHGEVVRYVPQPNGEAQRTVVADLGNRRAKDIWVGDMDGDGRDELYVAVEALTRGAEDSVEIVEPVQIRRYEAETAPTEGVVIATLQDRFTGLLTVGDVDGDGHREMVAAAFSSGLWVLRPGSNPRSEWSSECIDRDSSGFEHTSTFADLDGDGRDELYVAADDQGELRRYVWANGSPRREVIHRRDKQRAAHTWSIVPYDVASLEDGYGPDDSADGEGPFVEGTGRSTRSTVSVRPPTHHPGPSPGGERVDTNRVTPAISGGPSGRREHAGGRGGE